MVTLVCNHFPGHFKVKYTRCTYECHNKEMQFKTSFLLMGYNGETGRPQDSLGQHHKNAH